MLLFVYDALLTRIIFNVKKCYNIVNVLEGNEIRMKEDELLRLKELSKFESKYYSKGYNLIAGIDEAGRGPLAGPVVAACVILPEGCLIEGINDSKKISEKKRERLYDVITSQAVAWGVGIVGNCVIDEVNILNATRQAMKEAIDNLSVKPEFILIDAEKKVDTNGIPYLPIVKGDALSISIAAASIVAKVTRDRMMCEYDKEFPEYGFVKHKGYGTKMHIDALKRCGPCLLHRKSFIKKFVS